MSGGSAFWCCLNGDGIAFVKLEDTHLAVNLFWAISECQNLLCLALTSCFQKSARPGETSLANFLSAKVSGLSHLGLSLPSGLFPRKPCSGSLQIKKGLLKRVDFWASTRQLPGFLYLHFFSNIIALGNFGRKG